MTNAGKYDKRISIWTRRIWTDGGFQRIEPGRMITIVHASVKTTKGMTLIANGSDFEKAYTNFTIRYSKKTITRDMLVRYKDKTYTIEYLNNVNEDGVELELQCKEITH